MEKTSLGSNAVPKPTTAKNNKQPNTKTKDTEETLSSVKKPARNYHQRKPKNEHDQNQLLNSRSGKVDAIAAPPAPIPGISQNKDAQDIKKSSKSQTQKKGSQNLLSKPASAKISLERQSSTQVKNPNERSEKPEKPKRKPATKSIKEEKVTKSSISSVINQDKADVTSGADTNTNTKSTTSKPNYRIKNKNKLAAEPSSKATSKNSRAKLRTKIRAEKKNQATALLEVTTEKPNCKVEIRGLPHDLPSHIFWKSVEKSLPWYDQASEGEVVQVPKLVSILKKAPGISNTIQEILELDNNAEGSSQTQHLLSQPESTNADQLQQLKTEQSSELSDTAKTDSAPDTATETPHHGMKAQYPGYLGPTETVMVSVYNSNNIKVLGKYPYWKLFVAGKPSKRSSKPPTPSRAYVGFKTHEEALHFIKNYKNHKFVSKDMAVTMAKVGFTIFQKTPSSFKPRKDQLLNTIEKDPDFIQFAKAAQNVDSPENIETASTTTTEHTNLPVANVASTISNGISTVVGMDMALTTDTSTALLDYLRKKKQLSQQRQAEKKVTRRELKKSASAIAGSQLSTKSKGKNKRDEKTASSIIKLQTPKIATRQTELKKPNPAPGDFLKQGIKSPDGSQPKPPKSHKPNRGYKKTRDDKEPKKKPEKKNKPDPKSEAKKQQTSKNNQNRKAPIQV